MPNEVKQVTNKVIRRNANNAHPERILLVMVFDEDKIFRQLAWRRITNTRQNKWKGIRQFSPPTVNFETQSYVNLNN